MDVFSFWSNLDPLLFKSTNGIAFAALISVITEVDEYPASAQITRISESVTLSKVKMGSKVRLKSVTSAVLPVSDVDIIGKQVAPHPIEVLCPKKNLSTQYHLKRKDLDNLQEYCNHQWR